MQVSRLNHQVHEQIKAKYQGIGDLKQPRWLKASRWIPTFTMLIPNSKRVVAIDVIPSANIPRTIYREEVAVLKRQHPELRVIVCVLSEGLEVFAEATDFCRQLDCGLQAFTPEFGLQTVVTTDLDGAGGGEVATEQGWFPREIINKATGLTSLSFSATLDKFCRDIPACHDDATAAVDLVKTTIDELLQYYPNCHADAGSFMKLAHFESIYQLTGKGGTEHVLHSFRVFLAGCTVINKFYQTFAEAHYRFARGKNVSIEYCWLLVAVFHDIGYPWQGGKKLLEAALEDEDTDVTVTGKETRWLKDHYSQARRILSSLGAFVADGTDDSDGWDGGAIYDDKAKALGTEWIVLYDSFTSHAVISAFNMLASIVQQAIAANKRKNHVFVVAHAAPAALAILLHDWRIWEKARTWKLFPVDGTILPLASLLIFIDTWDDFKRQGPVSPISVDAFTIDSKGVAVTIRWRKAEDYEKEKVKYGAFKTSVKNNVFRMQINPVVASAS